MSYESLSGKPEYQQISSHFIKLVASQAQAGYEPVVREGGTVRAVGVLGSKNTQPEVIYHEPDQEIAVGIRYDNAPGYPNLALRVFPNEHARTEHLARYLVTTNCDSLLLADEVIAPDADSQALSTVLGIDPFPRQEVVDDRGDPRQVVGPEEYEALIGYVVGSTGLIQFPESGSIT